MIARARSWPHWSNIVSHYQDWRPAGSSHAHHGLTNHEDNSTVLEYWSFPKPFSIDLVTSSTISIDDICGRLIVYRWLKEYLVDILGQHLSLSPSNKKDSMFFILLRIIQELFTWTLQEEQPIFPILLYSFHTFKALSQPHFVSQSVGLKSG